MRKHRLLTIIIFILAIVVGIWFLNNFYLTHPQSHEGKTPVKQASFTRALVINMSLDAAPQLSEFFSDDDAILIVHVDNNPMVHTHDIVNSNAVLSAIFNENHYGRLDAYNPIFKNLELKYFANGAAYYLPVSKAGIRAIFINPKLYDQSQFISQDDPSPYAVGTFIMSNGGAHRIRHMIVDDYFIKQQPFTSDI